MPLHREFNPIDRDAIEELKAVARYHIDGRCNEMSTGCDGPGQWANLRCTREKDHPGLHVGHVGTDYRGFLGEDPVGYWVRS